MSELIDLLLDASVLINLLHVRRLDLLTVTGHFRPVVPEDVLEEIRLPDQREVLDGGPTRNGLRDPLR